MHGFVAFGCPLFMIRVVRFAIVGLAVTQTMFFSMFRVGASEARNACAYVTNDLPVVM